MKKRITLVVLLALVLASILGGLLYMARALFSESYSYAYGGFDYYLLTPSEIADMTGLCRHKPHFLTNQVSGPNSFQATTMRCRIVKDEIIRHLGQAGFITGRGGKFEKGNMEVLLSTNHVGDEVVDVTLFMTGGD